MEVAQTLYTEGVISKDTLDEVESLDGSLAGGPFTALSNTISSDPNQLKLFASILLQSKETVPIGEDILRECGKISITNYQFNIIIITEQSCHLSSPQHLGTSSPPPIRKEQTSSG